MITYVDAAKLRISTLPKEETKLTINSLINFGVPNTGPKETISEEAIKLSHEIIGTWAVSGSAPNAMTMSDLRHLAAQVARGLDRFLAEWQQRNTAYAQMQEAVND